MNKTWGYTKRPRNWKERLEKFYRKIDEEEEANLKHEPAVLEKPHVLEKPVIQIKSTSRRTDSRRTDSRTDDSSYSH